MVKRRVAARSWFPQSPVRRRLETQLWRPRSPRSCGVCGAADGEASQSGPTMWRASNKVWGGNSTHATQATDETWLRTDGLMASNWRTIDFYARHSTQHERGMFVVIDQTWSDETLYVRCPVSTVTITEAVEADLDFHTSPPSLLHTSKFTSVSSPNVMFECDFISFIAIIIFKWGDTTSFP